MRTIGVWAGLCVALVSSGALAASSGSPGSKAARAPAPSAPSGFV
jgi:hypothetical protein